MSGEHPLASGETSGGAGSPDPARSQPADLQGSVRGAQSRGPLRASGRDRPAPAGPERLRLGVATLLGLGRFPVASGTVASAATMPLAVALALGGPWVFLGGTAATIAIAFWSAGAGERCLGEKDPHAVVIDEVAGQLVTLAFIPLSPALFVAGFFLFRAFDVLKVPPARQLERVRGGAGIVLDDLAAGLWANVVLQIARAVVSRGGGP